MTIAMLPNSEIFKKVNGRVRDMLIHMNHWNLLEDCPEKKE